ncbi:breast cancer type 2 susceptibility protein [Anguilla anguilla]|uniref:breast cancer type 2 susceptibility protein n=1 Tax=Anguilla anguilla TaxID=7936 RepID=UPI0015AE429C|nr:breast cancer type 2 susceptibility protein [Anguilla anguilla]
MTGFSQRLLDPGTRVNMFEVFKHHIVQDLGPLCPNWFEELTVSAARDGASARDPEVPGGARVQEASLGTPLRKPAADSQIFSTPKIFKSRTAQSPELLTTDEELFSPDRGAAGGSKTLPWVDTSMCFFGSAKNSQTADKLGNTSLTADDFALLNIPKSRAAVSCKSISESLGAQLDPDVSWTSSLNTPPVISPTIILAKEEDKAGPVSPSGDKRVILVRELFPSMSKVSRMTEITEKPEGLFGQPSGADSRLGGLVKGSDCRELPSADARDGLWKQTLPDAIQDGEVRSTVASVLDGAEEVLSIFFSNGGSALRRVKAQERSSSRRRQACSAKAAAPTPPPPALESGRPEDPAKMAGRAECVADTVAFHKGNSPEAKDCGVTQWTPLTLPDTSGASPGTDFCAVPSSSDGGTAPATEELADGPADAAQLERPASKGDYKDIRVPGGASAQWDAVLPTNVANTQGQAVGPLHSDFPQQRAEASKSMRSEDSWPTALPLNPSFPQSDPGKCTIPANGPGINVCSTEMQTGVLVLRPGESPLLASSLEGCPAVTSTRKPPRKFVYSLQSPRLPVQAKHSDHSQTVSMPTVPFPGESLNGSTDAVVSSVKALHRSDNVTKDKSECKKLCEQASDASMAVVPAASNEVESGLDHMPLRCATSAEDYSQEWNPGRAPSGSADALGRDTDTRFSATACRSVMGSKQPRRPSAPVPTEKPGCADDPRDRDIVDCPSRGTAVLTECTQPAETSGLLRASDATRVTCDSGYHTTWSGATQLHGSSDIGHASSSRKVAENRAPVGFKTASNRRIPLSLEAMQRAKALLDEGAEGSGIKSSVSKGKPQMSESTERTQKSHYNGAKSSLAGNAAASRQRASLRKVSSPHSSLSSPQGSSPNPGFVGFKTASNGTIRLSSANLLKAKQLFKDIEDEKLLEVSPRTSCTDFDAVGGVEAETGTSSKSSAGLMAAPSRVRPSSEPKASEPYGCLTASQRADVTELCSLLEDAGSQFEFTQFRQAISTPAGSDEVVCNHPCDKEVDPDFLTGIDFDDSFSSECERQGSRKLPADTIMPEKLTASSYHKQNRQDSSHKSKPVEVLSYDFADKNAKVAKYTEDPSASLIPKNNYDSGSFVAFSSASGKKIAVSKEVLQRASKVFDDLDVGCVPSPSSVRRDKSTDPSHLNVLGATVTEVPRARNIPGAHVTFNTPRSNVMNQSHCIKKIGRSPGAVSPGGRSLKVGVSSENTQAIQEDSAISELNLPSGEPHPPHVCSSFQLPTVKNNLEVAGTALPRDLLAPCAPNGVGTDVRLDERPPPTPALSSAEDRKVGTANAILKQPGAVCSKGGLQRDTGKKLEVSHDQPSSMSNKRGAGFKTARGTAVNVSEGLLRKARLMFADLGENLETAQGRGFRGDEREGWNAVSENKEQPDASADATDKAKNISEKCKSENGAEQRTSAAGYGADEPDAVHVEKEIDATSVQEDFSRAETPNMGSESSVGCSTPCANKKALLETTSNECGRISGSCQMAAVSDEGSGSISTSNIQGNCGFSTAGGKKVTVSKKSLQYAQFLLNECSEMKTPEPGNASRLSNGHVSSHSLLGGNSGGFQTASGKGVAITPNALEQAKAMFQNCDDRPECGITGAVRGEGVSRGTRGDPMNPTATSSGFISAGGKGVSISAKALLEVKDMFKNSDGIVDCATTCGPREGHTHEKSFELKSNFRTVNCTFTSAGGKRVSVSEKALLRANALLKECDEKPHVESERLEFMAGSTPDPRHKNGRGFSTASGKGVSVSLRALREAKARFADCDDAASPEPGEVKAETLGENSTSAHKKDSTNSNCGFSTASGKGVSVSEKALLKAKALLSECCDVESGEPGRPLKMECKSSSVPNPPCESGCGTGAGSGKGLSTSVKNVCEMEVSSKDCSNDKIAIEIGGKDLKAKAGPYNNTGKRASGFSTARGNRVSVSVQALEEAKAKFRDCDHLDQVFGEEMKVDPIKNKISSAHRNPDKTAPGINAVDEKTASVSEMVLPSTNLLPAESDGIERSVVPSCCAHLPQGPLSQGQAADRQSARENGKAPVRPGGFAPSRERSAPGRAAVETADCETRRSSSPSLRSPGLSSCTDTQQRYLEQEAMACTRALLEDEDLAEQGLRGAPGRASLPPRSAVTEAEGTRGRGKRLQSEDSDFPDQPPLKRRLLADFDQTSDSDLRPVLTPVKSSPNVMLRDRRIFRYGVPLQPNVTHPPGGKKGILEQRHRKTEPEVVVPGSFLQDSKPVNPRGAVFVPPFRKGPKPEVQGTSLPAESRRPPSTFAPPFRKTQPSSTPLGQGPGQLSTSRPGTPPLPAVFVPPLRKLAGSASHPDPGSEEESGTHTPHSACGGAHSGQGPVTPNIPAGKEAETEEPAPAPPSPGDQEASRSDVQTLQSLQLARDLQDMRIRKKRRQAIRPQPGSLLLAKTSGVARVPLRSAVGGRCPGLHTPKELYACGVPCGASQIGSDSAESFRFRCGDFFREEVLAAGGGVQLADGGRLVPGNDGTAGKEEFYRALCDTPGVDPKLISEGWLYNHYRWVVWKRASMERAFPSVMGGYCLTPEQVLLQLKYRYDVEVDRSQRSALRKIMERDDTPAKTMVLCVCGVVSTGPAPAAPVQPESRTSPGSGAKAGGSSGGVIWVTDGWYAIKVLLDAPLTAMLLQGRLAVGGKVVTHGAELVGSQDACSPLEAPESLMLKISANSTRPARWDAKLGFHRDPRPFRLPLSSLYCNGGLVGCVDIVVLRSYPTQWMEKQPGGVFVFCSERSEGREARRHGDRRHKAMELLFSRVQAQFEREQEAKTKAGSRRRRLTRQEMEALQDGEELHEAVETDPAHLESCLNEQQLAVLSSYRESLGQERQARLQERFRQALAEAQEGEGGCPDRDVTPVWKLSVCDSRDRRSGSVYLLSVWRPPAELRPLLREGCRYRVYQLATSWGKKQAGRAAVQLTGTKKTQFQHIQAPPESLCELFQPRVSWSFRALRGAGFRPLCGEVDVVGYVVSITDRHGPSPVLYLADGHQDFVSVRIGASLAQLALEEVVKPRALLALSNLQPGHRTAVPAPAPVPALYAGELALFSTNPKEPHLQEACAHLRSIAQGNERFFQMAEEKLASFIPSNNQSALLTPRDVGPAPKMVNGQTPQQSVRSSGLLTPVRPPLPAGTPEDRDPKSVKRKRGLDFLSRIPSPPPLSPLLAHASPSLRKTFNPPRRSETPRPAPPPPPAPPPRRAPPPQEAEWVNDEELAMINTQALLDGQGGQEEAGVSR